MGEVKELLHEVRKGMILSYPHGTHIYTGKKKLIIKSKFFKSMTNRLLYLIEGNIIYGLIKLKCPEKINLTEFQELSSKHLISDDERNKWWPRKEVLYAYNFEFKLFEIPKKVNLQQTAKLFVEEFEFVTELIEDPKQYEPAKKPNSVLHDDWRIVSAWYCTIKHGGKTKYSLEDIIHLARIIYKELKKRDTEFHPDKMKPCALELFNIVSGKKKELTDLSDPTMLDSFEDKLIIKDFISVVGSVAEGKENPNDIDVLLRLNNPTPFIKRAVEIRLLKDLSFASDVHFIWGDPEGPHDTFIPLYDLQLKRIKPLKRVTMQENIIDFSMAKKFFPMKPSKRFYQLDEVIDYMFKSGQKYALEKKYNGFRAILYKSAGSIGLYSDQKKDISSKFPTIISEAKKLSNKDFVIDSELVLGEGGRAEIIKYVIGKEQLDDSQLQLHAFDIIHFGEEDLSSVPWHNRNSILHSLHFQPHIKEVNSIIVDSKIEAEKAIKLLRNMKRSEGAMIKSYTGKYTKNGESAAWIKFRNEDQLNVIVLDVESKPNGKVYKVGIHIKDPKKFHPDYLDGKVLILGKTFVTKENFEVGDHIEISVEEIWRHKYSKEDDVIRYSIHKPRPIKKVSEATTDWKVLDELVVSKGEEIIENEDATTTSSPGISDVSGKIWKKKKIPAPKKLEDMTEQDLQGSEGGEIMVKNFPDRMQANFNKVLDKWNPFVIQWHLRGQESIHTDLRLKAGDDLEGFTLFTPGSVGGEDKLDEVSSNIRGTIKLPQPKEWLTADGGYPAGSPGTTKEHSAYFAIIAKGKYRAVEVSDHKIVFELKSDSGKVKKMKAIQEEDKSQVDAFNKFLPENLKQLEGCYSYHIAHIEESRWVILFDKLKECPGGD